MTKKGGGPMGKRGPQAAPATLRVLKGNGVDKDIAGRPVKHGPNFDRSAPEPPRYLSKPAREEWDRVVAELEPLNLLKAADFGALLTHCEAFATWIMHLAKVRKEGSVIAHPVSGRPLKNPAQTILETAFAQYRNSCREFGLTPASEQNLASSSAALERDEFDPFSETG